MMKKPSNTIQSWIESESVDDIAEYAARGRKFANLSDVELSEAWVRALKQSAKNFQNTRLRDIHSDYTSEFRLRRLEPPYDLVSDDLNKMTDAVKKWAAGLSQEEREEIEYRAGKDFDAFQKRINKEKN
jgi:hypothetical protein